MRKRFLREKKSNVNVLLYSGVLLYLFIFIIIIIIIRHNNHRYNTTNFSGVHTNSDIVPDRSACFRVPKKQVPMRCQ